MRAIRPLLDFIFPPLCLACGQRRESRTSRVCSSCWSRIRTVDERSPLFVDAQAALLAGGQTSALVAAFVFEKDRPLQALLHALKYGGNTVIGEELGRVLAIRVAASPWSSRITAVVPVPLHRVKSRERGYNQAEIIASAVAGVLGVPSIPGLLVRSRHTPTQTHLGAAERRANVAGAFMAPPGRWCTGASLLLVDDVVTTGATMCEAARSLASAGAAECFAGAVAIAAL